MSNTQIATNLLKIWKSNCKEGNYIILSSKNFQTKAWKDYTFVVDKLLKKKVINWLNTHPAEEYDLYWCPLPFASAKRRKELVVGSTFLWSDIDDVPLEALEKKKIIPTYWWESSPGRLQGLWKMDKYLDPEDSQDLNRNLTYFIGGDVSGWDLTQVLRIPGTINHKYEGTPKVGDLVFTKKAYKFDKLSTRLEGIAPDLVEADFGGPSTPIPDDEGTIAALLKKYENKLPESTLDLIFTEEDEIIGDRSTKLWQLQHKLHDIGIPPEEAVILAKFSGWNKFRGRRDEDLRLRAEQSKIAKNTLKELKEHRQGKKRKTLIKGEISPPENKQFRLDNLKNIIEDPSEDPGWLVEGFWGSKSHGIVAGEPKTMKSILTTELAVSVASGLPFLGSFKVHQPGPVLIVQNENSRRIMRERLNKMLASKGLLKQGTAKVDKEGCLIFEPPSYKNIPLYSHNVQGVQINEPTHQAEIEWEIQELKPSLVIFDPLYLMFSGEINSAKELNPVLIWLLSIKERFGCAVILIHHWNKGGTGKEKVRGGQRMLGSTTLHGWIESAWYLRANSPGEEGENDPEITNAIDIANKQEGMALITLEREFRSEGLFPKVDLLLNLGEKDEAKFEVEILRHVAGADKRRINPGRPKSKEISMMDIREEILSVLGPREGKYSLNEIIGFTSMDKSQKRLISKAIAELVDEGVMYKEGVGKAIKYEIA